VLQYFNFFYQFEINCTHLWAERSSTSFFFYTESVYFYGVGYDSSQWV